MTISVVAPVYNEEAGIARFHRELLAALTQIPDSLREVIYVDDGSTDDSVAELVRITRGDPSVSIVRLSRNFGHQIAITAGLDRSNGDAVVVIDSDLQDPPELIVQMVEMWREGVEVVYAQRRVRAGESRFKLFSASAYYRILSTVGDVEIPRDTGDFRLMDRRVVDALCSMREENRFVRGMVSWVGFRQEPLPFDRRARESGSTHYGLLKMLRLALDGVTSFSEKPLRLATGIGFGVMFGALLGALYILAAKVLAPTQSISGFATVMITVLFLGGIQLLSLGLLGEYAGRTYREVKGRPLYIQRDVIRSESEFEA